VTGDDAWLSALRAVGDAPADAYVAEVMDVVRRTLGRPIRSGPRPA